jgi:exopolyphosphatase/guanosine-5'-triphosphate,3'-diphosphate pyrophosphatase
MNRSVAVIDVGSNTIKVIVATAEEQNLVILYDEVKEVRISKGISREHPHLSPEAIEAGVNAIAELWQAAQKIAKISTVRIVATSAVRSASNGEAFVERVKLKTGLIVEILSGDEEAKGIAAGISQDPHVRKKCSDFSLFDLGGGSMELGVFMSGTLRSRISLPLGAVRLTERFIAHPEKSIPQSELHSLEAFLKKSLNENPIKLAPPLIGTGGGVFVTRQIITSLTGIDSPFLQRHAIASLLNDLKNKSIEARLQTPALPTNRADIFPTALTTFLAVMDFAQTDQILHSQFNLKFGLAARLLGLV